MHYFIIFIFSFLKATSISIASIKFLGTHYIIGSGDTVMNVSCQSIPKGSQPVLTYAPFNASEARSYQEYYVESSGTVVADFQDGIYSGILSCSSIDGYTSLAYITLFEGQHDSVTCNSFIGNSLFCLHGVECVKIVIHPLQVLVSNVTIVQELE